MSSTKTITESVAAQQEAFEKNFAVDSRASLHDDEDPLVRYLRDRRLGTALEALRRHLDRPFGECDALVLCGGSGGEASYLRKAGFRRVINTDFSEVALAACRGRDPQLETRWLNAEQMDLEDESIDVVLVQDGLHHLPRPTLGFNEMLRVARRAVVVIEPRLGMAGRILGRQWEELGGATNYVFRWSDNLLEQLTRSQLLKRPLIIDVAARWDHSSCIHRLVRKCGPVGLPVAKAIYAALRPFDFCGNNFIGVVVKNDTAPG